MRAINTPDLQPFRSSRPCRLVLTGWFLIDCCHGAAILGVGLFARANNSGALLAVADCRNPARRNTHGDQHVFNRLGAALAERQIIFACASLVAMAFYGDRDVRVTPQPVGLSR